MEYGRASSKMVEEFIENLRTANCSCPLKKVETLETTKNLIGDKDPIPQENTGDSILNAFKSRPNFIGQVDAETGEQITYQQMRENSVKCALWLKKVGVKKGDVITICTRNPSVVYMPFLASIYIGAIVNPWEEKYFRDIIRVMYFLVKNEPDVIFVDGDNFTKLLLAAVILKSIKKIIKIVCIGEINPSIKLNSLETILNDDYDKAEIEEFSCEQNHMLDTVIRTFSSTARSYPGQVNVSYIAFRSPSNKQTPVMFPGDVGLWYGSLCWTHGPLLTVHAILSYVTAIKSAIFSENNLYKTIEKYKVTWVFLEGDMCNQLFQTNEDFISKYDVFSSLKTLLFDNYTIHQVIHKKLILVLRDVSVIRVYSKPAIGVIAYQRNSDPSLLSAGYVTKNVQLLFINKDIRKHLVPGDVTKIYCKTPYIPRCEHGKEQPWCYTGDTGYYEKDGLICVTIDQLRPFKTYKGVLLIPGIIENYIQYHPEVSDVIVTTLRHPVDFRHLVAYVKTKPGAKVTEKELMAFVEKCSRYNKCKLHEGVRFITDEIPRFPNGKINREYFRLLNIRSLCR